MKKAKIVAAGLAIILLFSLPLAAHAGHGGGEVFFGFGVGLLTGYLFAPRPVYVAPPVYVPPAPAYAPVSAPPAPAYVPAPAYSAPSPPGYSNNAATTAPPPSAQPRCREWRLIDRHLEDRWDSYYGRWRQVPVEKWGWVEVPCNN